MFERLLLRPVAASGVRWLAPVRIANAEVLSEMRRDFLVGAPFTLQAADPELFAAFWGAARESLIAGPADRAAREAIGTTISRLNACPYCVDAHAMVLAGAKEAGLARQAAGDQPASSPYVRWAEATLRPGAPELAAPPFAAADTAQMIGTAVVFHYINRLVNIFIGPSPFPAPTPSWLKRFVGGVTASGIASRRAAPAEGRHTPELPADLAWAASNPAVASAFARLSEAVEAAGARALTDEARSRLRLEIEAWDGAALSAPADEPQPIERLARLAAFASWRVDEALIKACRDTGADDRALLGAAAWASFTIARRIGARAAMV